MNIRSILLTNETNFCLSLHHNEAHNYFFDNCIENYKFKTKDSEINAAPLYLDNVSKVFSVDSMKKIGLNGYFYNFLVDFHGTDVVDISDIHKFLIVKNNINNVPVY